MLFRSVIRFQYPHIALQAGSGPDIDTQGLQRKGSLYNIRGRLAFRVAAADRLRRKSSEQRIGMVKGRSVTGTLRVISLPNLLVRAQSMLPGGVGLRTSSCKAVQPSGETRWQPEWIRLLPREW